MSKGPTVLEIIKFRLESGFGWDTTLTEIVKDYLEGWEYDGLYHDDCGCELADLAPCGLPNSQCRAGVKFPCPDSIAEGYNEDQMCEEGCEWHMGPREEKEGGNRA